MQFNDFLWAEEDAMRHRVNADKHHEKMMRHILIFGGCLYSLITVFVAFSVFAATWEWAGPGMFFLTFVLAAALGYAGYIGWLSWKTHGEKQLANMTPKEHLNYYQPEWTRVTVVPSAVWASSHAQPVRYAPARYQRQATMSTAAARQAADEDEMNDYDERREFWEDTHIGPEPF